MARNRPKGNGPHMVLEIKTYKNIEFDCKYFGDNFCCNFTGGRCNMKWAKVHCKYYEGVRPKSNSKNNCYINTKKMLIRK